MAGEHDASRGHQPAAPQTARSAGPAAETAAPQWGQTSTPQAFPTELAPGPPALPPSALLNVLGDACLRGRGNAPVRRGTMLALQQTIGNRALQRLLQRTPAVGAPAVQRAPVSTEQAPPAGSRAADQPASEAEDENAARYKAVDEHRRKLVAAKFQAEAERARAYLQEQFQWFEAQKMQSAEDPAQFLGAAQSQHTWYFYAAALEAEAGKLLKGGTLPEDLPGHPGSGFSSQQSDLFREAQSRALRAAEQEYQVYRERAQGPTTPGLTTDPKQWEEWQAKQSADKAEWRKS